MSESLGFFMVLAAAWLAIGLVLAIVMGRRGHDSFGWLVLGTLLGPMGVVLAVAARRTTNGCSRCRWSAGSPPPRASALSTSSSAPTGRRSRRRRWTQLSVSSATGSAG